MKIYVVDNYDSFVYNIIHLLKEIGVEEIKIVKNDQVNLDEIKQYDKIVLSPGPGIPQEAGLMMEVIKQFHQSHSILGVCLGHQAIGEFFGWVLQRLKEPLHGIASEITIQSKDCLFQNLESKNTIGHYHSWVVSPSEVEDLMPTAFDKDNNVMALKHKQYKVYGVQFHPESVLTQNGKTILKNWLSL